MSRVPTNFTYLLLPTPLTSADMASWLSAQRSVEAQSYVPVPSTIVIIKIDPVATLNDFGDEAVRQAAAAIQTKKYVVYTHQVR
jgi:hypothetical protein